MSNIKSTKDGLVEISSGKKIVSPLDRLDNLHPDTVEQRVKLLDRAIMTSEGPAPSIKDITERYNAFILLLSPPYKTSDKAHKPSQR